MSVLDIMELYFPYEMQLHNNRIQRDKIIKRTQMNKDMQNQNLPEYKLRFLEQMDQLRQEQIARTELQNEQPYLNTSNQRPTKPIQNNILNTSQYSSSNWRQHLNQSSYARNHNQSHYELNLLINPEVKRKENNIQLTSISEYSNALHNKTVFVNPKRTSC